MDKKFICDGGKYTISATNTIALPVILEDLPKEITINNNKLFLKDSFHVSLVCINQIIKKNNLAIPNFADSVVKDFCEFTKINDISLLGYKEEYRYMEENDLKTVVVMCELSSLRDFFTLLNDKYGLSLEYPPTHVTLYAADGKTGIFMTDSKDLENLTKPISNPIGRLL